MQFTFLASKSLGHFVCSLVFLQDTSLCHYVCMQESRPFCVQFSFLAT